MFRKSFTALLLASCVFSLPAYGETLSESLAAAYRKNPELMAERARLRATDEDYVQAAAQGRFTASTTASYGYTKSDSDFLNPGATIVSTSDSFKPRSFAITGQKPLYQGGRVRHLKNQAKYGIMAAREGLRSTEQNILLTAASAYTDVLRDEAIADIRRNNVRVLARQESAATDRFDVGAGTRTDIAQAQSRLAQAESGLAAADANLAQSRSAFFRATGYMPAQLAAVPDFALPPTLEATSRMALTYNPQLNAARYTEDAAGFAIDVAKAANSPVISLQTFAQANEGQSATLRSQDAIGLSANLTIPLVTGGLNASRIRAASATKNRNRFEVRNIEQAVEERVQSLWAQREGAIRTLAASQRQIDAAQVAYDGVEIEQQVGTRTALDVLNAEQEILNAKLTYAQSQRNLDVLTFQLLVLSGAFDALSLNLPVEKYDPRENLSQISDIGPLQPLLERIEDIPLAGPAIKKTADGIAGIPQATGLFKTKPESVLGADPKSARVTTPGINSFPAGYVADRAGDIPVERTTLQRMKDDLSVVRVPFLGKAPKPEDAP